MHACMHACMHGMCVCVFQLHVDILMLQSVPSQFHQNFPLAERVHGICHGCTTPWSYCTELGKFWTMQKDAERVFQWFSWWLERGLHMAQRNIGHSLLSKSGCQVDAGTYDGWRWMTVIKLLKVCPDSRTAFIAEDLLKKLFSHRFFSPAVLSGLCTNAFSGRPPCDCPEKSAIWMAQKHREVSGFAREAASPLQSQNLPFLWVIWRSLVTYSSSQDQNHLKRLWQIWHT